MRECISGAVASEINTHEYGILLITRSRCMLINGYGLWTMACQMMRSNALAAFELQLKTHLDCYASFSISHARPIYWIHLYSIHTEMRERPSIERRCCKLIQMNNSTSRSRIITDKLLLHLAFVTFFSFFLWNGRKTKKKLRPKWGGDWKEGWCVECGESERKRARARVEREWGSHRHNSVES